MIEHGRRNLRLHRHLCLQPDGGNFQGLKTHNAIKEILPRNSRMIMGIPVQGNSGCLNFESENFWPHS